MAGERMPPSASACARPTAGSPPGRRCGGPRLLHGVGLTIGPDGEADRPAGSACEYPWTDIIGHPTTRVIGGRPGIDAGLDAVFAAGARTGTALEICRYGVSSPSTATPTPSSTRPACGASCGRETRDREEPENSWR
jgi:hypothetical protein